VCGGGRLAASHIVRLREIDAMYKVLSFLSKRDDLTAAEFMEYYEKHHVPLILSLAPAPMLYKRRYIKGEDRIIRDAGEVDFDVVTELGFSDQAAFGTWMERLMDPSNGNIVAEDEAKFLNRTRTRAYAPEEFVTSE
jgi:EthD domain